MGERLGLLGVFEVVAAMKEIWKEVPNFPDYEVSDLGRVRSFKQATVRILSPSSDGRYWGVALSRDGEQYRHRIGRLVLLAFVGPLPGGMEMCHNDGDSFNDQLDNLRYDTHNANMQDASRHGVMTGGDHKPKLGRGEVYSIRAGFASGKHSRQELAEEYGVSRSLISHVLRGQRPYEGGLGPIQPRAYLRLSDQQVTAIREKRAFGESVASLAEEYGVSKSMISRIASGERHTKVAGPRICPWEIHLGRRQHEMPIDEERLADRAACIVDS